MSSLLNPTCNDPVYEWLPDHDLGVQWYRVWDDESLAGPRPPAFLHHEFLKYLGSATDPAITWRTWVRVGNCVFPHDFWTLLELNPALNAVKALHSGLEVSHPQYRFPDPYGYGEEDREVTEAFDKELKDRPNLRDPHEVECYRHDRRLDCQLEPTTSAGIFRDGAPDLEHTLLEGPVTDNDDDGFDIRCNGNPMPRHAAGSSLSQHIVVGNNARSFDRWLDMLAGIPPKQGNT
ncbi:predicted protein [Postia placenta Mad-698-R]|uniref:Uncharacterized protein n=1 Tax=Postia placenta MAD-698-R-SB12 TaxID=670580 RepID=A0A1X6MRB5_9APHY|nr:hypothetical protein POSPLADRAFT_1152161 [Postia placenta MAD-698-R-SB12]EED82169.1 predicted protein [Postia placenta Mad-698-R]OSX58830.1 hypothetical protein POSPLADRAFT_1152161 [Postia placenta MAD-698-R-SB12]